MPDVSRQLFELARVFREGARDYASGIERGSERGIKAAKALYDIRQGREAAGRAERRLTMEEKREKRRLPIEAANIRKAKETTRLFNVAEQERKTREATPWNFAQRASDYAPWFQRRVAENINLWGQTVHPEAYYDTDKKSPTYGHFTKGKGGEPINEEEVFRKSEELGGIVTMLMRPEEALADAAQMGDKQAQTTLDEIKRNPLARKQLYENWAVWQKQVQQYFNYLPPDTRKQWSKFIDETLKDVDNISQVGESFHVEGVPGIWRIQNGKATRIDKDSKLPKIEKRTRQDGFGNTWTFEYTRDPISGQERPYYSYMSKINTKMSPKDKTDLQISVDFIKEFNSAGLDEFGIIDEAQVAKARYHQARINKIQEKYDLTAPKEKVPEPTKKYKRTPKIEQRARQQTKPKIEGQWERTLREGRETEQNRTMTLEEAANDLMQDILNQPTQEAQERRLNDILSGLQDPKHEMLKAYLEFKVRQNQRWLGTE